MRKFVNNYKTIKKNNINEDKKQIKIEENTAPSINIPKHTIKTSYTDDTTKEKIKNEENNDSDDNENGDDENDENDDDDDDDDDSDEEDTTVAQKKFRPVFLKQAQRENLIERMGMEEELEAIEEDNRKRQEELQKEIRQEVIQYIQNEEENENKKALNIHSDDEMNMPDDNDDTTNIYEMENEFKNWKLRELKRIIEEKETKEQELKEEKELLLRRQMSDKEIEADNRKLGIKQKTEKKKSMKFMQKYYHPGVFFKDNSIVDEKMLQRNFMEPTGKDIYTNYETVPEAMKRKKKIWFNVSNKMDPFGRRRYHRYKIRLYI